MQDLAKSHPPPLHSQVCHGTRPVQPPLDPVAVAIVLRSQSEPGTAPRLCHYYAWIDSRTLPLQHPGTESFLDVDVTTPGLRAAPGLSCHLNRAWRSFWILPPLGSLEQLQDSAATMTTVAPVLHSQTQTSSWTPLLLQPVPDPLPDSTIMARPRSALVLCCHCCTPRLLHHHAQSDSQTLLPLHPDPEQLLDTATAGAIQRELDAKIEISTDRPTLDY
uniref:Uncharacterized protein n=1 Tax=Sphaerodactylus townsendi TaxID=933632 RepID=A0ACB8FHN5_9SAUR